MWNEYVCIHSRRSKLFCRVAETANVLQCHFPKHNKMSWGLLNKLIRNNRAVDSHIWRGWRHWCGIHGFQDGLWLSFNGTASSYWKVTSGIPQGTALGPIQFLNFIENLPWGLLLKLICLRMTASYFLVSQQTKTSQNWGI